MNPVDVGVRIGEQGIDITALVLQKHRKIPAHRRGEVQIQVIVMLEIGIGVFTVVAVAQHEGFEIRGLVAYGSGQALDPAFHHYCVVVGKTYGELRLTFIL